MSTGWQDMVARRIRQLEILQTSLDSCIGCGCLSLGRCTLFNDGDAAAAEGAGSRWMRSADAAGGRTPKAEGTTGERPQ